LKVLYWGYRENTPISYFRAGMFFPAFADLGVDARVLSLSDLAVEAIDWADVVVFRAWYDDGVTERAWDYASGKAARIYDTDDWDLDTPRHFPHYAEIKAQGPLIERMAREADLVTCATPVLASRYGVYNQRTLVLRNAVEPSLYEADGERPDSPVTALFYGPNGRLADYFGFTDERGRTHPGHAVAAVRAAHLRSMWIGCEGDVAPAEFDVVVRYDWDMRRFFRTLGNSHADIGLAPLIETEFNRAKSELHWLDMTAAGIPVVAQRFMGPGPYSALRPDTDALMARNAGEWRDAVRRLATSPALRADLVAAACERIATDYQPARRAGEWAEAFSSTL
jgi:hypothetical protein